MEKGFAQVFITSSNSHFFNKTDFEQHLVKQYRGVQQVSFYMQQKVLFLSPGRQHHLRSTDFIEHSCQFKFYCLKITSCYGNFNFKQIRSAKETKKN